MERQPLELPTEVRFAQVMPSSLGTLLAGDTARAMRRVQQEHPEIWERIERRAAELRAEREEAMERGAGKEVKA